MNKINIKFTVKEALRRAEDYFTFTSEEPIEIKGRRIEDPTIDIQISEALTDRRFQVIKPGDIITLIELDEDRVKIIESTNSDIAVKSRAFYDKITITPSKKSKVLSWINNPEGFCLSAGFNKDMRLEFINSLEAEVVGIGEVDTNSILDELEKFIRERKEEFHLNQYKHQNIDNGGKDFNGFDRGGRWQEAWWNYDREIRHISGNILHPAIFMNEERYQRIYDLLVNNLSAAEYVKIDDNDETKGYEDGAPAYMRRQKCTGHKRTPYKDSPEWEKGTPQNENNIIWIVSPESIARHNLSVVEPYNHINSEGIREINQEFTRSWEKLNNQRESLPTKKRKLLAKIERESRKKLTVEGEEIAIFAELKELILLNANDETEKIIQQARWNFRQIEINWILCKEKCKLIWLVSQLFGEEKPTVLEKKSADNKEELTPPQLDEVIEEEQEDNIEEEREQQEKNENDKKDISEPILIKAIAEEPAEIKNSSSLLEAKKSAQEQIKQLLKKNTLTNENLPPEYQNWQEEFQKLNSQQAIDQFLQQMEAAIAQKAQNLNQTAPSSKVNNNRHLLLLGLGAIGLGLGGLIILFVSLRKKKK